MQSNKTKNALILTGPQGSGNHLFSKVLSLHPDVQGWSDLNKTYWIGHDEEPYAEFWKNPDKILDHDWSEVNNLVTSISCPYIDNGVESIPKYLHFIGKLVRVGFNNVQIAIIGRDTNILSYQQNRVRGKVTKDLFLSAVKPLLLFNTVFISTELLYLYRQDYLRNLQRIISIPIDFANPLLDEILIKEPNTKYFKPIDEQPLDKLIHEASKPKALRKT